MKSLIVSKDRPVVASSLDAALEYAKRGFRVLPIYLAVDGECSCAGEKCPSPGKHPHLRDWPKNATTDATQIKKWWTRWPNDNIGIATGIGSRLLVIDVDGEEGEASLTELEDTYGPLPVTLTAKTARGKHLYFLHEGVEIRTSAGTRLGNGIDVRAEKGYVVAPPSTHVTGFIYEWINPECDPVVAPDWLLELLTEEDVPISGGVSTLNVVGTPITAGKRNSSLTSLAGSLRAEGKSAEEITTELIAANKSTCKHPLSPEEVKRIAASISSYPAGKKRGARTVPGGIDSPLFWFQFNVNDWCSDSEIRIMNDRQHGWLIQLMVTAFKGEGYLLNDPAKLWQWAGARTKKAFADSKSVLNQFKAVEIDGIPMLMHEELAVRYLNACRIIEQKREAGKVSAKNREKDRSIQAEIQNEPVRRTMPLSEGSIN